MPSFLAIFICVAFAMPAAAQEAAAVDAGPHDAVTRWQMDPATVLDASDVDLAAFQWIARPLVIFSDSPANPSFREQKDLLAESPGALVERDVAIIVDSDPSAETDVRRKLRPRGFMFALIGKDGGVKLQKPFPWDVRELSRSIDKTPLRQQEMRDANKPGG